jgi:hypothetical protein
MLEKLAESNLQEKKHDWALSTNSDMYTAYKGIQPGVDCHNKRIKESMKLSE